jgi:hypothetical protein
LRGVLAPLLDDPIQTAPDTTTQWCVFCRVNVQAPRWFEESDHTPDCAWRRRDALLGRA